MSSKSENVIADLDQFLGPYRRQPTKPPGDPLDDALLEQDKQLARDVKRVQLKRVMAEESKRLNELEGQMGNGEEKTATKTEGPEVDPRVFQIIAGLPADQQEQALEAYQKMVIAKGMKGEAAYMPLIVDAMRARPNSSTDNLVTAVTSIMDIVERARTPPASNGSDKLADALVTVATQNKGGGMQETAALITAIAEVVRGGQNSAPAADPVATAIGMIRDLKDLGMMGGQQAAPSGITDETRIRLEEIRRDTDIKLAELGLKKDTEMRKLDNDEKRTSAIGGLVERAAKVAGRAFGEGENEAGGAAVAQSAPAAQIAEQKCPSCGKTIGIPNPSVARKVVCPHCNSELQWDGKP